MMMRNLIVLLACLSTTHLASGAVRVLKLSDGKPFSMGKVDSRRLIRPGMGARKLTLNYSVFQPGFEFPQHVHPRSDDIFLVLQGQADVRQGESRKPLKTGQAVFVPAGQIHGGISSGEGTSILISFQCPPDEVLYTGKRDSSKAGAAKPVGVITPGAVKFVDFAARNGVFLGPKQGSTKVTAAYWKLRQGEKLTITNRADGEQFLFVWQGRLTLRTTKGALDVGKRETAFISGSEAFEAVNPAPGDAIVIQVSTVSAADASVAKKPNILLAISDDQSWQHAGAYGDRLVDTPAFHRVAREGVLFNYAFCSSPSCTPSRGALLTGQHTPTQEPTR